MSTGNTQPAQGGITGFLAKAPDPFHISNGGGGLDPLNLMGSPSPADPGPLSLPNFGIRPQFYNPNTFTARPMGDGPFNAMAARLAGPMYNPTLRHFGGAMGMPNPGGPSPVPAPTPGKPQMMGAPAIVDLMKKRIGGKFGGGY